MPRRKLIIAVVAAAALVAVALVVYVAVHGGDDKKSASPRSGGSSTTAGGPGTTGAITGSAPALPTGGGDAVTETAARATVVDYLNDVNERKRADAAKLICASHLAAWQQRADSADSDFNFTVVKAVFRDSSIDSAGALVTHYTLTFDDETSDKVDFTVVDEHGPKICGIETV